VFKNLGIVFVWNIMSEFSGGYDYEADRMAIQTAASIPVRPVARYIVFQCMIWNQFIDVLNHMITPHLRARTRSICGKLCAEKYDRCRKFEFLLILTFIIFLSF
jgi:hypothetical protein